jgi:hypothetical protein
MIRAKARKFVFAYGATARTAPFTTSRGPMRVRRACARDRVFRPRVSHSKYERQREPVLMTR